MGPFTVKERKSPVVYELNLPKNLRIHPVFHVSRLKEYRSTTDFPHRSTKPPPPEVKDGHDEYEVERIVDKRRRWNRVEYLVKWKGYGDHDNSWVLARDLDNAREAIQDYEDAQASGTTLI